MKLTGRMITLVLSVVMLVSLLPVGAVVSAENVEQKAFYMVNCSGLNFDTPVPYVYDLPEFYPVGFNNPDACCSAYGSIFIDDIAAEMKDDFNARPEGTRYFQFKLFRKALQEKNESVVYWDEAVEVTKEWLTEFLKEYKKIGGKLDGIIMDIEFDHVEGVYLYQWVYKGNVRDGVPANKNIYKDIVNDPRYQTEIRPMLVERGFKFWENPTGDQSEIWTINDGFSLNAQLKTDKYWRIWSNVMAIRMSEAVNEAVFAPLMKYYPNAILSDYQSTDSRTWLKPLDQFAAPGGLNTTKIGNTSNYNLYNYAVNDKVPGNKTPVAYNEAVFGTDPFDMTLWDVNTFKTMYEATDTGLVNAWIAGYNNKWGRDKVLTNCNTPYYTETLLHMGLMDMKPSFIGYIVGGEEGNNYETSLRVVSDILAELTRVAGTSDRKAISTPISWNGDYILSGMYAGGRNIWRLTPNTKVISLEDFKVKDNAPTFCIDGQTITFPQGSIIQDGSVRAVGTCGYWIETPANVVPVITSETDRYANNPAFEENFEQYSVGTTLTANTAKPKSVWQTSGSALKVQASGSNKVLAMTGTATLINAKVSQHVTAGDSYAKQQIWEVTFTLPNNLSSRAELYLLTCSDDDGGIKISNGKMYYDRNGAYKELSGVSLSAGTYTVKREVDFRDEDAYKCSYSIYDSNGSLIKDVKNVPMADETLPITTIGIACEDVSGNILIDNYKLYPTGVTTDFSLYDAEIGTQLTDIKQVRTKDTAYRLSWMNATNENKVAVVYNVKNGKVIQQVSMPAGQDGVITAVVEASGGSAVQLAVKTENGTAATPPATEPTPPPTEPAPPTTEPSAPDVTEPSTSEVTEPSTSEVTEPSTSEATEPSTSEITEPSTPDVTDPDADKGLTGGQTALIVTACVLVSGGGAAALLYVFKKEMFMFIVKKLLRK